MIEENTGRRGNVKMNYAVDGSVVKFLGRTCSYKGIRWCGLSGSGIAFKVTGTYARIKIVGDDTTAGGRLCAYRDLFKRKTCDRPGRDTAGGSDHRF